jgi:uncharacterized phosphatase
MSGPLRVALVRHGRTPLNDARRIQGRSDADLSPNGREDAASAGVELAGLADAAGRRWGAVVSSPLRRAVSTAARVAAALDVPVLEPIPLLTERDCGAAEGLPVDEATRRWPDAAYPGGETVEQLARRAAVAWREIESLDVADLVVVGHGLHLRAVARFVLGRDPGRLANGEVLVLEPE